MPSVFPALTVAVTVVLLATSVANAHICLTYPIQRGEHPSLFPGDPLCYQRYPNCGALKKGAPTATFQVGVLYSITFMQNLNHWYHPKPGHFDVAASWDNEATWFSLADPISDFPANNMNTQTVFTVPVVFNKTGTAIVRARYVSNNVNEVDPKNNTDAIFYSCADVSIVGDGENTMPPAPTPPTPAPTMQHATKESPKKITSEPACTAPSRWEAEGHEFVTGVAAPVIHHRIQYDTVKKMVRWARKGLLPGAASMTDLWNLTMAGGGAYTPQFIVGLKGPGTCSLYGGDKFFDWSFGAQSGMTFVKTHDRSQRRNDNNYTSEAEWAIASADFRFRSEAVSADGSTCLPKGWSHGNLRVELKPKMVDSFPAGTFDIPAECQSHQLSFDSAPNGGCKAHRSH